MSKSGVTEELEYALKDARDKVTVEVNREMRKFARRMIAEADRRVHEAFDALGEGEKFDPEAVADDAIQAVLSVLGLWEKKLAAHHRPRPGSARSCTLSRTT